MKRRDFLQKFSLGIASALALGADRLLGGDVSAYGVPEPPGPPKPPGPTSVHLVDPPYAHEIPSIPFDAPPGSWTLVVLPDTQSMSSGVAAEYDRQTDWIVAHQQRHNIRFVAHEGDIVDTNAARSQWLVAQKAMRTLTAAGIPYALLPGNHDLGSTNLASDRFTLLNDYFNLEDYRHSEGMALFEPGKMENSWHHFTAPTGKYLILALEYGPRDSVVDWASQIVAANPDRKVILLTHAYLTHKSARYNWKVQGREQAYTPKQDGIGSHGGINDGEDLWNKLVKNHANLFLVLCGHDLFNGTGYLLSRGDHGHRVHQILANYQLGVEPERPYNGGGYLRLMQFHPDGNVQVKSYSPWLNQWLTTPDQQFSFTI